MGRHRDLHPLLARAFVAGRCAGHSYTPPTLWAHNPCACRDVGLAETGDAAIGGVAQHSPHHRAFPAARLQVGTPSRLSRRVISPMLSPSTAGNLGRYVTVARPDGQPIEYLHPVKAIGVNGLHAVVIAPATSAFLDVITRAIRDHTAIFLRPFRRAV